MGKTAKRGVRESTVDIIESNKRLFNKILMTGKITRKLAENVMIYEQLCNVTYITVFRVFFHELCFKAKKVLSDSPLLSYVVRIILEQVHRSQSWQATLNNVEPWADQVNIECSFQRKLLK